MDALRNIDPQVSADLYLLTDMPVNTSDLNVKIGQSAVGSQVPNASGLQVGFQEKMTPVLYPPDKRDIRYLYVYNE